MYGITKARQLALFSLTNINKFNHDKSNAEIIFKNLTFDINNEHFTLIKYQQENEKNALIDIISGVDIQYTGYTYFLGNYINILDEKQRALLRNRMIGFVFKENYFFNHCNVFDNIYYSVVNHKDKKKLKNNIINTLKNLSQKDFIPDNDGTGKMQHCLVIFDLFLPTSQDTTVAIHPTVCSLYNPAVGLKIRVFDGF